VTTGKIDRVRPEGVYVSSGQYPSGGGDSTPIIRIERVNGDCTVDEMEFPLYEASKLQEDLSTVILGIRQ